MLRRFLLASFALLSTTLAWSASYKILHSFSGDPTGTPSSGLVVDKAGNAYGVTATDALHHAGTVYQISPKTGFKLIYGFSGPDGKQPQGNLAIDAAGNLYGTTVYGGANQTGCNNQGCGTVFRLSPPTNGGAWTETVLYSFQGGTGDGANPQAGIVLDSAGNLYGTTLNGGSHLLGTVFSLNSSQGDTWSETVLYGMEQGGGNPLGSLVFDTLGNLYGTTSNRGPKDGGIVFKLSPNLDGTWTFGLVYAFDATDGSQDGGAPSAGLIFDGSGNLYGTTAYGGKYRQGQFFGYGTVFELSPNLDGTWAESILYNFAGGADGATPLASVAFDTAGNLYGTTFAGGSPGFGCSGNGCGTVFQLTPGQNGQWTERRFVFPKNGSLGVQPTTSLLLDEKRSVYGTTTLSGPLGEGTMFRIIP